MPSALIIVDENSVVDLIIGLLLTVNNFFFAFGFYHFTMSYLGMDFFVFILIRVYFAS
jgi:hypothetical protein